MKKIPIVIDCDPGVDDAIAIMLARSKEVLDIRAITAVSGNVTLNYTTYNARLIAGLTKLDVPIAAGADQPIVKSRITSSKTHGTDGLGNYAGMFSEDVLAPLNDKYAVDLLYETIRDSDEPVTIVALGPLTNIAILLLAHPDIKPKINQICFMGGGFELGNVTSAAEFNFYVDPEAAQIVLNSGLPLAMAGLNVTLQADVHMEDIERFSKIKGVVPELGTKILEAYGKEDAALHDPVVILALTNPEIMQGKEFYVQVETNEGATRAMSYLDRRIRKKAQPNCYVITEIDRAKFIDEIEACFRFYEKFEQQKG